MQRLQEREQVQWVGVVMGGGGSTTTVLQQYYNSNTTLIQRYYSGVEHNCDDGPVIERGEGEGSMTG